MKRRRLSKKTQSRRRMTRWQKGGDEFSQQLQAFMERGEVDTLTKASEALGKVTDHAGQFLGSAFFYCSQPYVLTACRVVVDGTNQKRQGLKVQTVSSQMDAEAVWGDSQRDIAVLKVVGMTNNWLRASHIGLGQTGYVLGYSFDTNELRVSKGLISYTKIPGLEAQIAAHADNGYSGGPVLTRDGRVCGMILRGAGVKVWTTYFIPAYGIAALLSTTKLPNLVE